MIGEWIHGWVNDEQMASDGRKNVEMDDVEGSGCMVARG
jgi:hypothetical protein